jgi:AcrR family transcriptional regulator
LRKTPTQQRSRALVDSIVEATGRLIATEGLDALNTNRVAEAAGVSVGSLYQYFHDRSELIEAVVDRMSVETLAMLNQQLNLAAAQSIDIRALARLGLTAGLAFLRSNELYPELLRNWHRLPVHRLMDPLEQYFLSASRLYFLQNFREYPIQNLETRIYVLVNSAVFTLLRFLNQQSPFLKEEAIVDFLADTVAMSLEPQGRSEPLGAP